MFSPPLSFPPSLFFSELGCLTSLCKENVHSLAPNNGEVCACERADVRACVGPSACVCCVLLCTMLARVRRAPDNLMVVLWMNSYFVAPQMLL